MGLIKKKQSCNNLLSHALLSETKLVIFKLPRSELIQYRRLSVKSASIQKVCEIKSVWITKETFRLNFFGSIIKLTHIRHHKIEALEMVLCTEDQPTMKANIGQHCFIDVSLQHSYADRPFRWAWLSHRFLNDSTHRENNPEPELNHFTVTS